jgi:hypothetical protein
MLRGMDADSDFPTIHCQPEAAAHDSRTDAAEPDGAERIVLSERDTRILLELLDNPREANERMVAVLKAMPVETLPDEAVVRVDQETFDYFLSNHAAVRRPHGMRNGAVWWGERRGSGGRARLVPRARF